MFKKISLFILLLICPFKAIALIEVDITRGNLDPLPLAVSPLSIDDKSKKTLVSASSTEKEIKSGKSKKMDKSNLLGEMLAKRAKEKKINKVYFDSGSYKYHGRIKAFADSLRKNGLEF